jgi:hypothetical protein
MLEQISRASTSLNLDLMTNRNNASIRRQHAEIMHMINMSIVGSRQLAQGRTPHDAIKFFNLPR